MNPYSNLETKEEDIREFARNKEFKVLEYESCGNDAYIHLVDVDSGEYIVVCKTPPQLNIDGQLKLTSEMYLTLTNDNINLVHYKNGKKTIVFSTEYNKISNNGMIKYQKI